MKKLIDVPGISFDDSTYEGCIITQNNEVLVFIESWDAKKIKIEFLNVIEFIYNYAGAPSALYELPYDSSNSCLNQKGEQLSQKSRYKIYQIQDIDDSIMIEVIAESLHMTKQDQYNFERYKFF